MNPEDYEHVVSNMVDRITETQKQVYSTSSNIQIGELSDWYDALRRSETPSHVPSVYPKITPVQPWIDNGTSVIRPAVLPQDNSTVGNSTKTRISEVLVIPLNWTETETGWKANDQLFGVTYEIDNMEHAQIIEDARNAKVRAHTIIV